MYRRKQAFVDIAPLLTSGAIAAGNAYFYPKQSKTLYNINIGVSMKIIDLNQSTSLIVQKFAFSVVIQQMKEVCLISIVEDKLYCLHSTQQCKNRTAV